MNPEIWRHKLQLFSLEGLREPLSIYQSVHMAQRLPSDIFSQRCSKFHQERRKNMVMWLKKPRQLLWGNKSHRLLKYPLQSRRCSSHKLQNTVPFTWQPSHPRSLYFFIFPLSLSPTLFLSLPSLPIPLCIESI